jgi:neutral ceramidase
VTTTWTVPSGTPAGTYRIRHDGDAKALDGKIKPYQGISRTFVVQ